MGCKKLVEKASFEVKSEYKAMSVAISSMLTCSYADRREICILDHHDNWDMSKRGASLPSAMRETLGAALHEAPSSCWEVGHG